MLPALSSNANAPIGAAAAVPNTEVLGEDQRKNRVFYDSRSIIRCAFETQWTQIAPPDLRVNLNAGHHAAPLEARRHL
jgi:hypothetical protein